MVERRRHHYHAVSVIVVKQCPSARHVKIQVVCNSCMEKNRSKYPFTRKTRPNCNPRLIQPSFYRFMGIFFVEEQSSADLQHLKV